MTAPHLGPGHTVAGRYTIRALLGFTPEVATYDAIGSDGREVVIKLCDPAIGQRADVMAQLERVHAQVAALGSEGAVAVFDSGYDGGTAAPFSVCEKLRIPSLARLVEQGPQAPSVMATVMNGVAAILDAARAQGLFHLALKPTNVFVGPAPSYAVRITDFGASVIRSTSPTHEAYAQSAPWWAPEQMQPAARLGAPTDVFAAALVAFYALTARSYWLSCQSRPPDLVAWQMEVMGQRVPASARARELGVQLDPALDDAFARSLAIGQGDRPGSIGELARALAAARQPAVTAAAKTLAFPDMAFSESGFPRAFDNGGEATVVMDAPQQGAGRPPQPAAVQPAYAPPPADDSGAQVTPGLPPFPKPVKKKNPTMVPIIIGVASAVVLGGVGVAFLFLRSPGGDTEVASAVASSSASEDGAASAEPPSTGSADSSARAAGDEPPAASASASAQPDAKVRVVLKCVPACDRLLVDNEAVAAPDQPLELDPGKHTVKAVKAGYVTLTETIEVVADKPLEKELRLSPVRPVAPRPQPRNCGQFLNPCK